MILGFSLTASSSLCALPKSTLGLIVLLLYLSASQAKPPEEPASSTQLVFVCLLMQAKMEIGKGCMMNIEQF